MENIEMPTLREILTKGKHLTKDGSFSTGGWSADARMLNKYMDQKCVIATSTNWFGSWILFRSQKGWMNYVALNLPLQGYKFFKIGFRRIEGKVGAILLKDIEENPADLKIYNQELFGKWRKIILLEAMKDNENE